jgi:hypothetical protein
LHIIYIYILIDPFVWWSLPAGDAVRVPGANRHGAADDAGGHRPKGWLGMILGVRLCVVRYGF